MEASRMVTYSPTHLLTYSPTHLLKPKTTKPQRSQRSQRQNVYSGISVDHCSNQSVHRKHFGSNSELYFSSNHSVVFPLCSLCPLWRPFQFESPIHLLITK